MPLARIAIWALSVGAVFLIFLILGGSGEAQAKVGEAAVLFVLFSINSLGGFFLIERRPELTLFSVSTIGLSVATYFVGLDSLFSHSLISTSASGSSRDAVGLLLIITLLAGQASMMLAFRRDEDSPYLARRPAPTVPAVG